ncbi:MAG: DUF2130 domain-containing protein [Smithella sp.]
MTEPTITCPNCKTEIKLTESLATPLIEATRKEFEKRLSQKDADIVKRESTVREKEEALSKAKEAIDEQIARVMQATVGMYGDLQGIAGKTLQEIEGLDLKALE